MAIGLSLGGPTGYAINPARDLGPRIAHAVLPIAGKGDSDWGYAWIPVIGPIIGGVLGALVYQHRVEVMKYILALDQGTTSSRAIVFDHAGSIVSVAQKEFPQIFPKPGWVEHDPRDIWSTQAGVAAEALTKANVARARTSPPSASPTSARRRVVWDRATGEPICNAIVWQDRRTAGICDRLKARKLDRVIRRKTGLVDRRVLLRHEGAVDSRERERRDARRAKRGRARLRHGRLVARLESHRRRSARHRREQRVAHDAATTSARATGTTSC